MPEARHSPSLSVCIDAVFEGLAETEAIASVARAGLPAIEFWKWWDKDLEALEAARAEHGLDLAAFCTRFISLVDSSKRTEYLDGFGETVEVAQRLGAKVVISQVGDELSGVPRKAQQESLIEGLRAAAPMAEAAGVVLAIEPLNVLVDHPGYYLVRSDEAFEIVRVVDSPAVKVLFDIYHQQISEGHLIANLRENIDWIGHFHAAGNPGRNELDCGEINYREVFRAIAEAGYQGYCGLEYWPRTDVLSEIERGLGNCLADSRRS